MMSDALLAQSAVDRLTAGARTLIIEGPPTGDETAPTSTPVLTPRARPTMLNNTSKWSHARGNEVVPSRWQATVVWFALWVPLFLTSGDGAEPPVWAWFGPLMKTVGPKHLTTLAPASN